MQRKMQIKRLQNYEVFLNLQKKNDKKLPMSVYNTFIGSVLFCQY